jgi:hypothetical protein
VDSDLGYRSRSQGARTLCRSIDETIQIGSDQTPQVPYNPQSNKDASSGPDPTTAARLDKLESVISTVIRHHGGLWGYPHIKEFMAGKYHVLINNKV